MNITKSYTDLINQHNYAIADYAREIKYQESLSEPDRDLLHDLKALYETEKMRLLNAWELIKAKGEEFLKEVFNIIKGVFEELVSDIIAFLKKHSLNEIIDLVKGLF